MTNSENLFSPGWYSDITNTDYHQSNGLSSSTLKKFIRQTPASILYDKSNPQPQSDEMKLGSAVHGLILEPNFFNRDFAVLPELNLRLKADRAERDQFMEENSGKIVISRETKKIASDMAESVWENNTASLLLSSSINEQSIYWQHEHDDGSVLLKARADALPTKYPFIVDIKTTRDASWSFMQLDIKKRLYHLSAYMYLCGFNSNDTIKQTLGHGKFLSFCLVCVENKPPYQVACYEMSEQYLAKGQEIFNLALSRYFNAELTGWQGYPDKLRLIDPLDWESITTL